MFIAHRRPWWASYLVFRPGTPVLSVKGRAQARAHRTLSSGGLWFLTCCFWHDGSILCSTALSSSQCSGGHFYGKLRHHLRICSILPRGRAESFKGTKGTKIQSWHLQFENPKFWPRTERLLQAHAKENFSVLTRKLSKKQIAKN